MPTPETPDEISTRRTDSEFAMMPWQVFAYFQRCINGCRGEKATWRLTTRRSGNPADASTAMFCALPSCACTILNRSEDNRRRKLVIPPAPSRASSKPSALARLASGLSNGQTIS
jgi:hypothetical protein